MFGTILVPLDGSDLSEHAIPVADRLAGLSGDRVLLTMVVDHRDYSALESYRAFPMSGSGGVTMPPAEDREEIEKRLRADAETYLGRQKARFGRPNDVEVAVLSGDPASEILEAAKREGVGLVVMGTRGRSGFVRGLLGSVADRVLRSSEGPVVAVPPENRWAADGGDASSLHVIVPLDGSKRSESALKAAVPIAREAGGTLVIAHFISVESRYTGMPFNEAPPLRANLSEIRDLATGYLEQVAESVEDDGFAIEPHIAAGHPANQIADLVGVTPNAIVVMTSHGRSGLTRWLMGSITDATVRTVAAPVMVVPARAD